VALDFVVFHALLDSSVTTATPLWILDIV